MEENQWISFPRLVINQLPSPGVKYSGGENRRSDCFRDFSRFRSFECVSDSQENGAKQACAETYSPETILRRKSQVRSTLPDPGVICPITFAPVLEATSSA
jgi:hypothetical protein